MSLTVSPELLSKAEKDQVSNQEFVRCIEQSLPYAYHMVAGLAARLKAGDTAPGRPFADNQTEPETDAERGQLLRAMASDSMRAALSEHFGVRIAFQNCHRVAVFPADGSADEAIGIFSSPRAQLLNQSPELVSC
ncbi:MAG: hypothetical protein HOQ05_09500 [Corynebacteriales bacterium]|nr:hypothetical protein [Mycobacteriales bacterium]